jgi:hypothetical protein
MDKYFESQELSKLTQRGISNLNRPVRYEDIELVVTKLLTKRSLGPSGFPAEFYKTFKELILILHKIFQKVENGGTLPSSLHKACITLMQRHHQKNTDLYHNYEHKNLQQTNKLID